MSSWQPISQWKPSSYIPKHRLPPRKRVIPTSATGKKISSIATASQIQGRVDQPAGGTREETIPLSRQSTAAGTPVQRHSSDSTSAKEKEENIIAALDAINRQLENHARSLTSTHDKLDLFTQSAYKSFTEVTHAIGEVQTRLTEEKKEILDHITGAFVYFNNILNDALPSEQEGIWKQNHFAGGTLSNHLFNDSSLGFGQNANGRECGGGAVDMARGASNQSSTSLWSDSVWHTAPTSPFMEHTIMPMDDTHTPRQGGMEGTLPTVQEIGSSLDLTMDWLDLVKPAGVDNNEYEPSLVSTLDPFAPNAMSPSTFRQLLESFDRASILSSGVESLPSDCTRESSLPHEGQRDLRHRKSSQAFRPSVNSADHIYGIAGTFQIARDRARRSTRGSSSMASPPPQDRAIRGASIAPPFQVLPEGDGKKTDSMAKWPTKGRNTVKGRCPEIICDECHGRVHWACAGLQDNDQLKSEPWSCPECDRVHETSGEEPVAIISAQMDRCLRPDCILRGFKRIHRKDNDEDEYFIERIIGRRSIGRKTNGDRIFEFLVKWVDWEMYECTWEPAKHISELSYWHDHFVSDANQAGVDLHWKTALLPETAEWWDERGDLRIQKCIDGGIEPKTWWF